MAAEENHSNRRADKETAKHQKSAELQAEADDPKEIRGIV